MTGLASQWRAGPGRLICGIAPQAWCLLGSIVLLAMTGSAEARSRPTLVPELEAMIPTFECVSSVHSDTGAESDAKFWGCLQQAGLLGVDPEADLTRIEGYKVRAVSNWWLFGRDPRRPLGTASLPPIFDYVRCVEQAAYKDKAFSGKSEKLLQEATARVMQACKDHPLSAIELGSRAAFEASNIRERMVAAAFTSLNLRYVLEANHWFPDEMRPCVSRAGSGKREGNCKNLPVAVPPPPRTLEPDPGQKSGN